VGQTALERVVVVMAFGIDGCACPWLRMGPARIKHRIVVRRVVLAGASSPALILVPFAGA